MSLSQNGFLALLPFVREEFVLTRTQVGYYSTFFYLSSAVLAVFTGSVVDRVGSKKGVTFGVLCLGSVIVLFGFSPSYIVILLLALLAGVGHSIINPSVNKAVISDTPPEKHAVSMGIVMSGLGIGGLLGASLMPLMGESFGWRMTTQLAGVFVILIGVIVYKLYREKSKSNQLEDQQGVRMDEPPSLKNNLHFFITEKRFLFTCMFGIILGGFSVGVVFAHYAVFLSEDLQMTRSAAGLGLGVFQIGGIIGRPAWGWFSDRLLLGDRGKALSVLGLTSGIIFIILGTIFNSFQLSLPVVYFFSFLLGFSIFGWGGLYFVAIAEIAGSARTGAAIGTGLLFNRIGILIAPPIFGMIADLHESYNYSWLLFGAVIILVSALYYLSRSKQQVTS